MSEEEHIHGSKGLQHYDDLKVIFNKLNINVDIITGR